MQILENKIISLELVAVLPVKYFPSRAYVLTNGLKISDMIKKHLYQLKFFQSDEHRW